MKNKRQYWRWIYWIVLIILVAVYPIYWTAVIHTTPENPDQFIDPTGLNIALAILLSVCWYGALWVATLVYEIILFACKKISKRRFLIALILLFAVLLTVVGVLFVNSLIS